jgi:hypothetical protein
MVHRDKLKQARGQDQNTRALATIHSLDAKRDKLIADYTYARCAMTRLRAASKTESRFPPLSIKDTERHSVVDRRALGDSRRREGRIWSAATTGDTVPRDNNPHAIVDEDGDFQSM